MSKAGQFREQVTLITPTAAISDGVGGFIGGSSSEVSCWARVQVQAGSEQLRLGIIEAGQPYKVTLRYEHSLTSNLRVRWNDIEMHVSTIVHNERKTETILYCNALR